RQYGQIFLQPEDLQKNGGTYQGIIDEVRPPETNAKFPKPILVLSDGTLVRLNPSSVGKLMVEFGFDSADWIGRSVLFTVQQGLIDNKSTAWINAEPLTSDTSAPETMAGNGISPILPTIPAKPSTPSKSRTSRDTDVPF